MEIGRNNLGNFVYIMPVTRGADSQGPYYTFSARGTKFHYKPNDVASRKTAKTKATNQGGKRARTVAGKGKKAAARK